MRESEGLRWERERGVEGESERVSERLKWERERRVEGESERE